MILVRKYCIPFYWNEKKLPIRISQSFSSKMIKSTYWFSDHNNTHNCSDRKRRQSMVWCALTPYHKIAITPFSGEYTPYRDLLKVNWVSLLRWAKISLGFAILKPGIWKRRLFYVKNDWFKIVLLALRNCSAKQTLCQRNPGYDAFFWLFNQKHQMGLNRLSLSIFPSFMKHHFSSLMQTVTHLLLF